MNESMTLPAGSPPQAPATDPNFRPTQDPEIGAKVEESAPNAPSSTVALAVRLRGNLNVPALQRALGEVLRQRVRLTLEDISTLPGDESAQTYLQLAEEAAHTVLDSSDAPRALLVQMASDESVLLFAIQRAIRRTGLVRELGDAYAGRPGKEALARDPRKETPDFWKQKLLGATNLDLPTDYPRTSAQRSRTDSYSWELGGAPAETMVAAFLCLLHRYTGQEDIVIHALMGELVPLRCDISGQPTVNELMHRVSGCLREALDNSGGYDASFRASVLFEVCDFQAVEAGGVRFQTELLPGESSTYDLSLRIEGPCGIFRYNPGLFTLDTIQRIAGHLQSVLRAIQGDATQLIARLPLLSDDEHRMMIQGWNKTQTEYPRTECIHDLFAGQARRTPEAVAVTFENRSLTYRELDIWSNQIAKGLQREGVGPGTRVGVCINRGLEMMVALLAIHKAGGAYVPMDPAYPQERIAFMMEDAQSPLLITERELAKQFPDAKLFFVDPLDPNGSATGLSSQVTPEDLAYVIYTSGSTGKPKGVMVRHRNVVNFFTGMDTSIGSEPGVWLAVTSISFDISVLELFWTITRGFKVVIQADERRASAGYTLAEQIKQHEVTHFQCTPSLVLMMLEDPNTDAALRSVKKLFFGGEPMPPALVQRLQGFGEIFNMYGPTETTIWSTVHPVTRSGGKITIGRPIANTAIYILDRNLQPCPIGVPGELYIAGEGVVCGYLNRPELTAERFIRNPFGHNPDDRMYRTGDLARFRHDGEIEFLGRVDHQVKLRGYRIELGEIEAALRQHLSVKESVVSVWEAAANDKRLVGYVLPQAGVKPEAVELRRFLRQKLPDYMVPSLFVTLEAMPLTPNGKIDRKALPKPDLRRTAAESRGVAGSMASGKEASRTRPVQGTDAPEASAAGPVLPRVVRTLPLTDGQKEIWFASQLSPGASCAFNESTVLHLKGPFDENALTGAIQNVVARHEALRTTFDSSGQEQCVHAEMPLVLRAVDVSAEPDFAAALNQNCAAEVEVPFDLVRGPLARFRLLRRAADYHVLLVTVHHTICDGGSLGVLVHELGEYYSAARKATAWNPPVAQQFYEFAEQQRKAKTSAEYRKAEQFWLNQFATTPPLLDLPTDRPRPPVRSYRGGAAWRPLGTELTNDLRKLSTRQRCTLFTTLLAAFYTFLHRLSGQTEILVGVPAAARDGTGSDRLVGHCVNFLPLRLEVPAESSFTEHLKRLRGLLLDAYDHQNYTLGNLLQKLNLGRDTSRPLVAVMFNLDWSREELTMADLEVAVTPNAKVFSSFDLSFNLADSRGELELQCVYSSELFDLETVERWMGHFHTLLRSIATQTETPLCDLPILTDAEKRVLLEEWNQTKIPLPAGKLVHQLFEAQAARSPAAIALRSQNGTVSYEALNRQANQIANHLQSKGVKPGMLVAVCLARSPELLTTLLGIMKVGAAYVPMDPEYPAARLRQMMAVAHAELIVTTTAWHQQLFQDVPGVLIDRDWDRIELTSDVLSVAPAKDSDLAYVMFTSGSTGGPKAVGLEHRNAVAFLCWAKDQFTAEELGGVFASTSICFDLSVFELFAPISWGGTIVLADNPMQLATHSARSHVRLVNTVPSAVPELLKAGLPPSVTTFNLAGEALAQKLVDELYEVPTIKQVYDLYGPTENTTYSTGALRVKGGRATIGRPLANAEAYIVDAKLHPVPIGVPGELLVGGAFLTRGYLGADEMTQQKFIAHPFRTEPGSRLYRTGDLTRYFPNGEIEFLGRIDHQIKIRGYRVEPGDIEAELEAHKAILECAVILREDTPGHQRIAAYFVTRPGGEVSANELREFLRDRLPAYMIPTAFVQLESLPLTPNGKLDRRALPAPEQVTSSQQDAPNEEPLSEVEQMLADIWQEVIGLDAIGRHDNFFDLGGHSILITQIISRCRNGLGVELTLRNFFETPTIAELAPIVEQQLLEQLEQVPKSPGVRSSQAEVLSKD